MNAASKRGCSPFFLSHSVAGPASLAPNPETPARTPYRHSHSLLGTRIVQRPAASIITHRRRKAPTRTGTWRLRGSGGRRVRGPRGHRRPHPLDGQEKLDAWSPPRCRGDSVDLGCQVLRVAAPGNGASVFAVVFSVEAVAAPSPAAVSPMGVLPLAPDTFPVTTPERHCSRHQHRSHHRHR
jgi:hypothetical protein